MLWADIDLEFYLYISDLNICILVLIKYSYFISDFKNNSCSLENNSNITGR